MRHAIIDRISREIVALDPREGGPILPEHGDYLAVELADEDVSLMRASFGTFRLGDDGRVVSTPVLVVPKAPTAREILAAELEAATTLAAVKAALAKWARAQS